MSIGFIGAGNMATAIIKGYISKAKTDIFVYDLDEKKMDSLVKLGAEKLDSITEMVQTVKYLFLAVKPQNFADIMPELRGLVNEETVIVSIAAGITAEYLKKELNYDVKVVLVMPNTPLLLGVGASALAKIAPTTEDEFAVVCDMFKSSGIIAEVPPEKMNEIIAIHGSSPAFIYQYAKHFVEYGKSEGFSEELATRFFAQALLGASKMITDSGYSLDELIKMVSSKGGTTIAGLNSLEADGLGNTVKNACSACTKRAYELTK